MDFGEVVRELNDSSAHFRVGALQKLRVDIRGGAQNRNGMRLVRYPKGAQHAFHWGGRKELQFNVGLEEDDASGQALRYGVAFSLQPSGSYPIEEIRSSLIPKIDRFNQYVRWNSGALATMRMWDWHGVRPVPRRPEPIYPNPPCDGEFIFLGKMRPLHQWNPKEVLKTFDELLPLYEYVQSDGASSLEYMRPEETGFRFRPGPPPKQVKTTGERDSGPYQMRLRHNEMQRRLYKKLVSEYGKDKVGSEVPSGNGARIDLVVHCEKDSYVFYEIKTGWEPRICIREAIGQLLEYGYWGDGVRAPSRLVIVGPNPPEDNSQNYLDTLKGNFDLSVEYQHLEAD